MATELSPKNLVRARSGLLPSRTLGLPTVGKVGTNRQYKKFSSTDDGFFVLWEFRRQGASVL